MQRLPSRSLSSFRIGTASFIAVAVSASCAAQVTPEDDSTGGTSVMGTGGSTGGNESGGSGGKGGTMGSGGKMGTGGSAAGTGGTGPTSGGGPGVGGGAGTGATGGGATGGGAGTVGSVGGAAGTGGVMSSGGSGGMPSAGGAGGRFGGMGGRGGTAAGGAGTGGTATGGAGAGGSGTGGAAGDPCAVTRTLTGGQTTQSNNDWGEAAGLDWTIWSSGTGGSITTYDIPAFKAAWNNSGDFLARIGLQWNATQKYTAFGTITAEFNSKKTGSAGGYSYVGVYGWSVNPCVEYYIVDDSYNNMPVNPGMTTNKGTAMIDGGTYTLYTRNTTGTGGSKCSGVSNWVQFYSIRQSARTCGVISITKHFDAWAAAGMALGNMDQAQLLIEAGGGVGSIEFTVANVTTTMN